MELPLFPVGDVVLLPGVVLDLHVFEPRYRELLGRVRASGEPFGVPRVEMTAGPSLAGEAARDLRSSLARVGSLAHLTEVAYYPDGRADIKVVGGERYRIEEFDGDRFPYVVARAEPWPLEPSNPEWVASLSREAVSRFLARVSPRLGDVRSEVPDDPLLVASFIAANLHLAGEVGQRVLEAASLVERFELLLDVMVAPRERLN